MFSNIHPLAELRELWSFKSFRARIFMAIVPTAIALVIGHFATDRHRPYDFHVRESYIIPPRGVEGQDMSVHWRVTQRRSCPGTVERQLVDPNTGVIVAAYNPEPAEEGMVTDGWLHKTFKVPRDIQAGNIAYQSKLTYQCNWLQVLMPALAIRYTTPRLIFTVEK